MNKEKSNFESVDWEAQWALHGLGYRDGYLHVNLQDYYSKSGQLSTLRLKPGPGFGDLSHSTTRLVLKLMGPHIQGKDVLDVGCGSGILSLAAAGMGAKSACGIDIDQEALKHASENSRLNGLKTLKFLTSKSYCKRPPAKELVVLMNMIQTEQVQAWDSLKPIQNAVTMIISSGILAEGREEYLVQCKMWGWELVEERQEDGWLGFVSNKKGA